MYNRYRLRWILIVCMPQKTAIHAEIISNDLTFRVAILTLKEEQTIKQLINHPQSPVFSSKASALIVHSSSICVTLDIYKKKKKGKLERNGTGDKNAKFEVSSLK